MAWSDERHGDPEIYFRRMARDGAAIGPEIVVSLQGDRDGLALVWNGTEYAIVWVYDRELFFRRLDAAGNGIGAGLRVTTRVDDGSAMDPRMVWTGSGYGLTWGFGSRLRFARLDASGERVGPSRIITTAGYEHDLVWTGTEYGVAWALSSRRGVGFARLDASGTTLYTNVHVSDPAADGTRYVSLAWTGSEYGIAWMDNRRRTPWEALNDIYLTRLDAMGNKIGAVSRIVQAQWGNGYQTPSLVWSGGEYGVAYGGYQAILFVRVDASGNGIGSHVRISDLRSGGYEPELVWTGEGYGVAWPDFRHPPTYEYEIYFNEVDCLD
jgi:hypothetical protein